MVLKSVRAKHYQDGDVKKNMTEEKEKGEGPAQDFCLDAKLFTNSWDTTLVSPLMT